jgi:hypothetical protein
VKYFKRELISYEIDCAVIQAHCFNLTFREYYLFGLFTLDRLFTRYTTLDIDFVKYCNKLDSLISEKRHVKR